MTHLKTHTVCMLFSALLILSCSGDDDNPISEEGGPPPAELVGTWTFQSVTVDGTTADLGTVMEWVAGAVLARFTIASNGAYSYEEVNSSGGQLWAEIGFVFVEGASVEINILSNSDGLFNEEIANTFAINGNTLTLQQIELGMTIVFTLTK